jgi:ribosomal protein S18 acetylase RimI-like enzyme
MRIRPAKHEDDAAIWNILEPIIRAGETYSLPRDMSRADALAYWRSSGHAVFVAEDDGRIVGTYFLRANQKGGGDHVANCGYMTAPDASGRGVARTMAQHSLHEAKARGFATMQFNFVVATNARAVALWERLGFVTLGRIPRAFRHPKLGPVDALIMFRDLSDMPAASGTQDGQA